MKNANVALSILLTAIVTSKYGVVAGLGFGAVFVALYVVALLVARKV